MGLTKMKYKKRIGGLLVLAGLIVAFYVFTKLGEPQVRDEDAIAANAGPEVPVSVVSMRRGRIEETLAAYGSVVPAPGQMEIFSVPFESRVRRNHVTTGMEVAAGVPLVDVEPSPDTRLQLDETRIERDSAAAALDLVVQRMSLQLATQQELLAAQQALDNVTARLQSMTDRGIGGPWVIRASGPGVINRVSAQPGQIVAAGGTLVETISHDGIIVQLGVENEDLIHLANDQPVRLVRVNRTGEAPVVGRLTAISQQVNPETRLVDLYVQPPKETRLLLNEYVEGQIVTAADDALIVPRSAVLPEAGRFVLYTVSQNQATKHFVSVGLENADEVEVSGGDLKEGLSVVILGNSQLADGMRVRVESSR